MRMYVLYSVVNAFSVATELCFWIAAAAFGLLLSSSHNPMVLRNVVQQAHRKLIGFVMYLSVCVFCLLLEHVHS